VASELSRGGVPLSCTPARRSSIRAFSFPGHLVVVAEGELRAPCHSVEIVRTFFEPGVGPPLFYTVNECVDPRVRCVDRLTPYERSETFAEETVPDTITVVHAEGRDEVRVEPLRDPPVTDDGVTVVGRSRSLSFQEAFADALGRLPRPAEPPQPDELSSVKVVEIGGEFGGIAGFHHLYVKIRRG
jgi:hypothetical protein